MKRRKDPRRRRALHRRMGGSNPRISRSPRRVPAEVDDRLRVAVVDALGRRLPVNDLAAWLVRVAPVAARRRSVSVALLSDDRVKRLNRQFRKKNRTTDVLSFPGESGASAAGPRDFLGDIVIATGTAREQAHRLGHAYGTELRILALHGLLHLLGYDHTSDEGQMARVEARLLKRGGVGRGLLRRMIELGAPGRSPA